MANIDTKTFISPNAIADGTINGSKIADGSVTTDKIADGNITSDKLYNSAVTNAKIADDAVTADKIGYQAVTSYKINEKAVITSRINDGAVTNDKLADLSITTDKIEDFSITTDKIAMGSVTNDKITDGAVTSAKIANGAITEGKLIGNAVTTSKINNSAVTTEKINDLAVTTNKIADGAVTTDKIGGEAVTSDELADSAVINSKIHDNAITTAKIVNNAITTVKIHDLDVTNDKIANKTITGGKIKNQTIWSNKLTWQTLSDASSDVDSSGVLYTPVGPVETAAMFDNNVLSLGRPDGLLIEYTRDYSHEDGSANWSEYYLSNYDQNYNDIKKVNMMTNGDPGSYAYFAGGKNYVADADGKLNSGSTNSNRKRAHDGDALRFTFDAKGLGVYAQVVQIYAFISTNGSNITVNGSKIGRLKVKLETSTVSNPNSFTTVSDNITVTGWSGWNAIPFNGARFGHPNYTNISNSNYVQKIRLTFTSEGAASDGNNWFCVYQFKFLATDAWGFPSELAKNKHLYKTEVTSIIDSKDSSGNDIRVPYTSMNTDGDIKANTIYEGNKKLSDKYVLYKDDGTSLVEGKLKSYVGYGYQNNTGAYSGLFISGAHAAGNYGGQLNGSFDGEHLSYRAYNNGTFTNWKELAFKSQIDTLNTTINTKISTVESTFNTQITNLTNTTQKAVYDYLPNPDDISDTTTNPTILAKSDGTHDGTFSFYDTKFYNSQSASSNRVQVAYGYDNDYIGYRRYYNGAWTHFKKVAFEGHTHQPVVVRLYNGWGNSISADVFGYDGPYSDIVSIDNTFYKIYIKSIINKSGNYECPVDCIIDDIDASQLNLFTNNESIYYIYIPDAYPLGHPTNLVKTMDCMTGKKITLIKNHANSNSSIVNKIYNYIYTNRETSPYAPPASNDNYYYFAYPSTSNCLDTNSNFNMYVTKYNLDTYLVNTCKSNNSMYLSVIEFISNGKYWIVNNIDK